MAKNKRIFEDPEELGSLEENPPESPELAEAIREMSGQMKGLRSDVGKFMSTSPATNNPRPADPAEDPQPLSTDQVKAFLESEQGKSMLAGSAHLEASKAQRAVNIFRRLRQIPDEIEELNCDRAAFTENGERKRAADKKLAAALEAERSELQLELDRMLEELPEPPAEEQKKDKWNA